MCHGQACPRRPAGTVYLPPELQRVLNTIKDLDERSEGAAAIAAEPWRQALGGGLEGQQSSTRHCCAPSACRPGCPDPGECGSGAAESAQHQPPQERPRRGEALAGAGLSLHIVLRLLHAGHACHMQLLRCSLFCISAAMSSPPCCRMDLLPQQPQVAELRARIEADQKLLIQFSEEKVQLAVQVRPARRAGRGGAGGTRALAAPLWLWKQFLSRRWLASLALPSA